MPAEDLHTDGNEIGGLLRQVFVAEMTAAERVCQSCGQQSAIGAHRLFKGAGYVLRCPGCGDVAARVSVLPDRYVIGLGGSWSVARGD